LALPLNTYVKEGTKMNKETRQIAVPTAE